MPLASGQLLGPYEIVSLLGAGGMGEVYEARDTRLGRTVAIKVLPEWIASNANVRARFEREARAVSQISHSNVCTLHDIGEAENLHFLVLEYCRGETLAERLKRGALPLADVLRFGAQIADALDAAHRRGIVHRDLKPANVMLTSSGAKLLDFGLARVASREDGVAEELPSMVQGSEGLKTEKGVVLGTFPYMSPEQVEGREVDTRTDIFSLGAVLYEMATGERAFPGGSAGSVMAAVLKEEPAPLSDALTVSQPILEHVVERCLEKDAEDRWQSARDVAAELRWIADSEPGAATAEPVERSSRRERWAWGSALVFAVLALAALALWLGGRGAEEAEPLVFQIPFADQTQLEGMALHPEGGALVSAQRRHGESRLYLHHFDRLEPEPILGSEGATRPFFSPDGAWLGYLADGELRKVPTAGGTPVSLCAMERLVGAAWSEDGRIVFSYGPPSGLWRVPATGGTPEPVTEIRLDAEEEERVDLHFAPHFLPGGDILFTRWSSGSRSQYSVMVLPAGGGEPRRLVHGIGSGYDPGGYLLYADPRQGVLNAVPFDAGALEIVGDPVVVARDARATQDSVAGLATGTLAYQASREPPRRLVWLDPGGGIEEVPLREDLWSTVRLAPDGRRAAVVTANEDGTEAEIWIADVERGTTTRFTDHVAGDWNPLWSPDGRWIVFDSDRDGPPNLFRASVHGGEAQRLLPGENAIQRPWSFTPDGEFLLFTQRGLERTESGVEVAPSASPRRLHMESGKSTLLFPSQSNVTQLILSPDGRRLAYLSDETGGYEVYVRSFPDLGGKQQVSLGGVEVLSRPRWSPGSDTLYYPQNDQLMAVPVSRGDALELGRPQEALDFSLVDTYDVGPDGRILAVEYTTEVGNRLVVMRSWTQSLAAAR